MGRGSLRNTDLPSDDTAEPDSQRNTVAKMPKINVYDTDCGELKQLTYNERFAEFAVTKPVKLEDFIVYEFSGYDTNGPFTKQKRYSDFY